MDEIEMNTRFCQMMMDELLSRGEPIVTGEEIFPENAQDDDDSADR